MFENAKKKINKKENYGFESLYTIKLVVAETD